MCGSVFTWEGWAGTGQDVPPAALFLALICICSLLRVETSPLVPGCPFTESLLSYLLSCLRVRIPAYAKLCPSRALGQGSLGLVARMCDTRSINPIVCQSACPPHSQKEGQLCVLKKATTPCTKCHSFCLGLGPGSEIHRQFIIFLNYSQND